MKRLWIRRIVLSMAAVLLAGMPALGQQNESKQPAEPSVVKSTSKPESKQLATPSMVKSASKPMSKQPPGDPVHSPAQVKITALTVKAGQVMVVLEREGKASIDPSQISTTRLELVISGQRKSWSLSQMDPNLRGLNGPKGKAVFATGLALEKAEQVRAQLLGGGAPQKPMIAILGTEAPTTPIRQARAKGPASSEGAPDTTFHPLAMVVMPRGGENWHPGETHEIIWGVVPMDHEPIAHWSIGIISDTFRYNVCTSGGSCSQTDPNLVSFNPTTRLYSAQFTVPDLGEVPMGSYSFFVSGGCTTESGGVDGGCVRDGESLGAVHIALPEELLEAMANLMQGPDFDLSPIASRVYVGNVVRLEWDSDEAAPSPGNPVGPRYDLALFRGNQFVRELDSVGPRGQFDWVVGDWCALEEDGVTPCRCDDAAIRTGDNFYIRLTRTTSSHVSGEWGPFSIRWPNITVTRPTNNYLWQLGASGEITWTSEGLEGSSRKAELVLYDDAGVRLFTIGHAVVSEGWFSWRGGQMERPEFQSPDAYTGRDVGPGRYFVRVEMMGCASHIAGASPRFELFEF